MRNISSRSARVFTVSLDRCGMHKTACRGQESSLSPSECIAGLVIALPRARSERDGRSEATEFPLGMYADVEDYGAFLKKNHCVPWLDPSTGPHSRSDRQWLVYATIADSEVWLAQTVQVLLEAP